MASDKRERLPGIERRYELTMKSLQNTLLEIQARLAWLEARAISLRRIASELEEMALAGDKADPSLAVREFMDVTERVLSYCEQVRQLANGRPKAVLVVKEVPVRIPPVPSVN
jgi:hypothetical protein